MSKDSFDEVDLSGLSAMASKRVPQYVHAPETIRQLIVALGKYDEKKRQALFRQAHGLMYAPEDLIRKCLKYSTDPDMNWSVVQCAVKSYPRGFKGDILHTNDEDRWIHTLLLLRFYTFDLPMDRLTTLLNEESMNEGVRKTLIDIASKVAKGETPHNTKTAWLKAKEMELWIEEAEGL